MRNATEKLLSVAGKLSNMLLARKLAGQNSTAVYTDTMAVSVAKVTVDDVAKQAYTLGETGEVLKFDLPASFPIPGNVMDVGVQVRNLFLCCCKL